MSPHHRPVASALVVAVLLSPAAVGAQSTRASAPAGAPAATADRLARIGTDMFANPDRIPAAIAELKTILAGEPDSAVAHMLLGAAYGGLKDPKLTGEAIAELRQALAIDDQLVTARFYLAGVYLDLGRVDRAHDELTRALAQAPGQPQFLTSLSEAERRLGHADQAVEAAQHALRADAASPQAHYQLALAQIDLGRRDEAIRELEGVVRAGAGIPDVLLALGTAYLDAGRTADARTVLGRGLDAAPASLDLRLALARAERISGALDQAEHLLTAPRPNIAALSDPEYVRQVDIRTNMELGLLRQQQGRLDAAAAAFRVVLAADPEHGPAHRGLAEIALQQGAWADAREHAARAAALGAPLPVTLRTKFREQLHAPAAEGRP